MLDDIARCIQASEGITYEQAFARACAEHPSYYQQYSQTFREENLGRAEQAQQPRQPVELDGPGRATERHMLDQAEAIVQQKMAQGLNRYQALSQAYSELGDVYNNVQSIQAFAEVTGAPQPQQFGGLVESDAHTWLNNSTPSQSLLEKHNGLVAAEYRLCPSDTPRSVVEARVFKKHPKHHERMASYR
jgi:hypothetical protein